MSETSSNAACPSEIVRNRRARRAGQRRERAARLRRGGVGLGILFSLLMAVAILMGGLAYANLTRDLPSAETLPALLNPPDGALLQPTRVYDRTGQHLLLTFSPSGLSRGSGEASLVPRRYIPINPNAPQHLPDFLVRATIAVADPGFWSHAGYLWNGWNDPEAHPTIAQKLVSDLLLYDEKPSLRRALRERILAAQVTARYGRTQVLEWYLNSADFGNHAYGVDAAAQSYFGVAASELTQAESAVLAAVTQAPSLNPFDARDVALQRGQTTVKLMQALGLVSPQEAKRALDQSSIPVLSAPPPQKTFAPAFLSLVLKQLDGLFTRDRIERGGLSVTTTLDYDLQSRAACTTLVYAARLAGKSDPSTSCPSADLLPSLPPDTSVTKPSASALVLDPTSGQVLAAVGETLEDGETAFISAHDSGSLRTPFVYMTAFTRGMGPASLVWDIPSGENVTEPDGQYHGPVRVRTALANDYIVPAQDVADRMGSDAVNRTEASFGLDQPNENLLNLAAAYGVFAADGVRYGQPETFAPTAVLRVEALDHRPWLDLTDPQAQPVVTPALAYLMNNVLSDESARWPSLGHPNSFEIGRPAGAKVGQTQSGADVWAVGYTPTRVVAVWTGTHAMDAPRLSPRLPAALWNALTQLATRSLPPDGWAMPPGVTRMDVCDPSGLLPTKDCPSVVSEVFLNGDEPVQSDNLFKVYQINRETGYLATVFTPPQLIEDKVFMLVPPEAQAWAKSANVPQPPTSYDAIQATPPNPDVNITSPDMFANVSGQVRFVGTASGADFEHYRILVGKGLNPQNWIAIGDNSTTPVENGILGTWDTTGLNGLYAVQLQVIRTDDRIDTAIMQVTISNK